MQKRICLSLSMTHDSMFWMLNVFTNVFYIPESSLKSLMLNLRPMTADLLLHYGPDH